MIDLYLDSQPDLWNETLCLRAFLHNTLRLLE